MDRTGKGDGDTVVQPADMELRAALRDLEEARRDFERIRQELDETAGEWGPLSDELDQCRQDRARCQSVLSSLLDGLGAGVLVLDSDLRVAELSGRAPELLGISEADPDGHRLSAIGLGAIGSKIEQRARSVLEGDEPAKLVVGDLRVTLVPMPAQGGGRDLVLVVVDEPVPAH